jgi:hypothetical protein
MPTAARLWITASLSKFCAPCSPNTPTSAQAFATFAAIDASSGKRSRATETVSAAHFAKSAVPVSRSVRVTYQIFPVFSQEFPPIAFAARTKARLGIPELI